MTRTTTIRRCLIGGVAALSFGLAACGGDDESSDDTTATDETSATDDTAVDDTTVDDTATDDTGASTSAPATTTGGDGGDVDVDAYVDAAIDELGFEDTAVAECVSRALIENIDPADLAAAGSPEEFVSAPSIDQLGIEVTDEMRAQMLADAEGCDGLAAALVESEFGDDPEVAACVSELLTDQIVADLFVAQLSGGTPSDEAIAIFEQTEACDEGA